MNRKDIYERMAEESGEYKKDCHKFLNIALDTIKKELMEADPETSITFRGFGKFHVKKRKGWKIPGGYGDGDMKYKPSCRSVKFTAGGKLADIMKMPLTDLGYKPPEGAWDYGSSGSVIKQD